MNAQPSSYAADPAIDPPPDFLPLNELHRVSLEHSLGYFGDAPYVIFGYCVGGREVIWRDGNSSGFGSGGWKAFLEEIVPIARRSGVDLGSADSAGTHVLLIDRGRHTIYAATRESAERFLAQLYGLPVPRRLCLCGVIDCSTRPGCSSSCHHP